VLRSRYSGIWRFISGGEALTNLLPDLIFTIYPESFFPFLTLLMGVACFSKMLVYIYQIIWRHNPEDWILNIQHWEILKLHRTKPVVFNLGHLKISNVNRNETQEHLKPWASSVPCTHEDSSPNWGAGMPGTNLIISWRGQNHINN
jgi:hypothetical protein